MTDEPLGEDTADPTPEGDVPGETGGARPWMPPSPNRALAERLAAAREEAPQPVAPPEPVRPASAFDAPRPVVAAHPQPRAKRRSRAWVLPVIIGLVALVAIAAVGSLAYSNQNRADRWEARAFRLERNTEQLNGLLIERSTQLNERTREVNQIAKKFALQQGALTRSESDVASLSERQQELAAEKAAVEDSRAALAIQAATLDDVAGELVGCNDGLVELLGYVLQGDSATVDALIDGVVADCDSAEASFAQYRARYG